MAHVDEIGLATWVECLTRAHEDLLIEAAQAGVVVAAPRFVDLRRLLAKCRVVKNPTEQLLDLIGHCSCLVEYTEQRNHQDSQREVPLEAR